MKRKLSELIKEKVDFLEVCYDNGEYDEMICFEIIKEKYGDIEIDLNSKEGVFLMKEVFENEQNREVKSRKMTPEEKIEFGKRLFN